MSCNYLLKYRTYKKKYTTLKKIMFYGGCNINEEKINNIIRDLDKSEIDTKMKILDEYIETFEGYKYDKKYI